MKALYFEDYRVGDTFRSGGYTFTESAIVDFAMKYDPQPFHIDTVAAEKTHFRGLIASGWQVIATSFRLLVDAGFLRGGAMGAGRLEFAEWSKPVRPGDTIRAEATVVETRPSSSRDDRGYVIVEFTVYNQHEELVAAYRCPEIIARRPAAPANGS